MAASNMTIEVRFSSEGGHGSRGIWEPGVTYASGVIFSIPDAGYPATISRDPRLYAYIQVARPGDFSLLFINSLLAIRFHTPDVSKEFATYRFLFEGTYFVLDFRTLECEDKNAARA